jgi:hypothetical protein
VNTVRAAIHTPGEFARHLQQAIPKKFPTESDIFQDIMAVIDEFSEVEIDLQSGEISITTKNSASVRARGVRESSRP